MLAYASYLYTHDYGGDLYAPAVFQALIQSAGGRHSWNIHNGSISRLAISPRDGRLLTVSTFGEIFSHQIHGSQMQTTRLMSDKHFWFSDLYVAPDGKVYAISYTGQLVISDGQQTRVMVVENISKPFSLQNLNDGKSLLIVGENSVALFDNATERIIATRRLDFQVTCTGRRDNKPLLFDHRGQMHLVNSLDKMTSEKVPVKGKVTAYASNRKEHLTAYGMADGTIWLTDGSGKTHKLVEHLSRVTRLMFNGKRLYSSSYDGKLLFWPIESNSQINAVTLYQSAHWLNDFTFSDNKDYILVGEHNGSVTQCLISLPKIAERLRQNVKRNFTQEEWNYYVGKGIPYRKVKVI
jgi:WD40 repeat protein